MDNRPPIERVRDREDAPKNFEEDRETLTQKEAKLQPKATDKASNQESEEQFQARMRDKLKASDDNDDE